MRWWSISSGSNCVWTLALQWQHDSSECHFSVTLPGSSSKVLHKYSYAKWIKKKTMTFNQKGGHCLSSPSQLQDVTCLYSPSAVVEKGWFVHSSSVGFLMHAAVQLAGVAVLVCLLTSSIPAGSKRCCTAPSNATYAGVRLLWEDSPFSVLHQGQDSRS